jgi:hypothetical protein
MTEDINKEEMTIEPMPAALLAGMFPRGVVAIAEEFSGQKEEVTSVAKKPDITVPPANTKAPISSMQAGKAIQYLGAFGKKIVVVVTDPTSLHLNQEDLDFLSKVLTAVKLSLADVAIVNSATQQLEYFALQEQLPAVVALYFGIQPVDIGAPIKFPQFQVQKWNSCTFLYAPAFEEMGPLAQNAVALKKELWAALQKIFAS